MGMMKEADKFYSLAIQAIPKIAVAYNNRGDVRRKMGRYAKALEDFLAADRLGQPNELIRCNVIRGYLETSQPDKALQAFDQTQAQGIKLDDALKQEILQKIKP